MFSVSDCTSLTTLSVCKPLLVIYAHIASHCSSNRTTLCISFSVPVVHEVQVHTHEQIANCHCQMRQFKKKTFTCTCMFMKGGGGGACLHVYIITLRGTNTCMLGSKKLPYPFRAMDPLVHGDLCVHMYTITCVILLFRIIVYDASTRKYLNSSVKFPHTVVCME